MIKQIEKEQQSNSLDSKVKNVWQVRDARSDLMFAREAARMVLGVYVSYVRNQSQGEEPDENMLALAHKAIEYIEPESIREQVQLPQFRQRRGLNWRVFNERNPDAQKANAAFRSACYVFNIHDALRHPDRHPRNTHGIVDLAYEHRRMAYVEARHAQDLGPSDFHEEFRDRVKENIRHAFIGRNSIYGIALEEAGLDSRDSRFYQSLKPWGLQGLGSGAVSQMGVYCPVQMLTKDRNDLRRQHGIGKKTTDIINKNLKELGAELGMIDLRVVEDKYGYGV